jgi:hypothetical protein
VNLCKKCKHPESYKFHNGSGSYADHLFEPSEVCPNEKPSAEGPYKGETVYENGEGDSKEIITGPLLPEDGVDIDKFDNSGDIAQLGNVAFREGQKSRDAELKEAMELLDEAVDNERGEKWLTRFIALGKKVQL